MVEEKVKQTVPKIVKEKTLAQAVPQVVPSLNVLYFVECSDGISRGHVEAVEKELGAASGDLLYLVIHTLGGDIYSAVRIMRILQSRFKKIKVIVPDYAYSSGTVMCLGCDEIIMAVDATLGPLDKPIEHPKDGSSISSLDITQTLTNIASICSSTAVQIYEKLRSDHTGDDHSTDMKLSKKEAAQLAFETAVKIVTPITAQIDPYSLQRGFREAKIGYYYAIDMLYSRMMKKSFRQTLNTSKRLVNDFPSHGYGIFRDEARDVLNLTVSDLEKLVEWKRLETRFSEIEKDYSKLVEYAVVQ